MNTVLTVQDDAAVETDFRVARKSKNSLQYPCEKYLILRQKVAL